MAFEQPTASSSSPGLSTSRSVSRSVLQTAVEPARFAALPFWPSSAAALAAEAACTS